MTSQTTPNEARSTLDEARRFIRAGARRGLPPRWYNFVLAVVHAGFANRLADVASRPDGAELDFYMWWGVLTLAMMGLQHFGWRAWGAAARYGPIHWSVLAVSWLGVIGVGTFGAALKAHWDLGWGPWAAGSAVLLISFAAMEIHRRVILARDADGAARAMERRP